jgi:hypothetical protein
MNFPRMSATLIVAFLLGLAIAGLAPQQLPVTVYKLSLITVAAVAGYYIDRELFPYARPDCYQHDPLMEFAFGVAQLRRALIVAACIIGAALGA